MKAAELVPLIGAYARRELPARAQTQLDQAIAFALCATAAQQAAAILDPDEARTRWSIACELEHRLAAFVEADRPPLTPLEHRLAAMLARAGCPRSARRLFDLIV